MTTPCRCYQPACSACHFQAACAACRSIARELDERGVGVTILGGVAGPDALFEVERLGYRSLPVLVASGASPAAGAAAPVRAPRGELDHAELDAGARSHPADSDGRLVDEQRLEITRIAR